MEKRISKKKTLGNIFKDIDIYFDILKEKKNLWEDFSKTNNSISKEFSIFYQNYLLEYNKNNFDKIYDLSVCKVEKNKIVFCLPLYLSEKDNHFNLSSNFEVILEPFTDKSIIEKKDYYLKKCLSLIKHIAKYYKVNKLLFEKKLIYSSLSIWDKNILKSEKKIYNMYEHHLDLTLDEKQIWSKIRKSYKGLINKHKKNFQIYRINNDDLSTWKLFKKLHLEIATKKTRSDKTWMIQYKSILNNSSQLFYIIDQRNKFLGGSYFDCTKTEAFYSVGVYRRDYFHYPLSHMLMHYAYIFFKKNNYKKIDFGNYFFQNKFLSAKEQNIQNFKSGFATHIVPKFNILSDLRYLDEEKH